MGATISDGQWLEFWKKKDAGAFDSQDFQWVLDHWRVIHDLRLGNFKAVDAAEIGALTERIAQMEPVTTMAAVSTFPALVTYIQPSFADLRRAFGWINNDFAKADFKPIDRCREVSRETREVAFEYVHLDRDASTDAVLAEMDRLGLRPALYEELLAFAAKYPDEQREYPIVALGSVWCDFYGALFVASLDRDDSERGLYLGWVGGDWNGRCRFLAVRKPARNA